MSGKMGQRETGKKPSSTRRHDAVASGAFGQENPERIREGTELNRKISGARDRKHSKYKDRKS